MGKISIIARQTERNVVDTESYIPIPYDYLLNDDVKAKIHLSELKRMNSQVYIFGAKIIPAITNDVEEIKKEIEYSKKIDNAKKQYEKLMKNLQGAVEGKKIEVDPDAYKDLRDLLKAGIEAKNNEDYNSEKQ